MTNSTKGEFTSHCQIAAKTNFLMLFPARFAHARYSSRMIDRFLNWGDHGKPKSGKIKGHCQHPLDTTDQTLILSMGCLCKEIPCWCPSEGHKYGRRKFSETSAIELCYETRQFASISRSLTLKLLLILVQGLFRLQKLER